MKPIGVGAFPAPTEDFPVPAERGNWKIAYSILELQRELASANAEMAGDFAKFPAAREFEDQGRSCFCKWLDMIRAVSL
jgi:hypothetical protein